MHNTQLPRIASPLPPPPRFPYPTYAEICPHGHSTSARIWNVVYATAEVQAQSQCTEFLSPTDLSTPILDLPHRSSSSLHISPCTIQAHPGSETWNLDIEFRSPRTSILPTTIDPSLICRTLFDDDFNEQQNQDLDITTSNSSHWDFFNYSSSLGSEPGLCFSVEQIVHDPTAVDPSVLSTDLFIGGQDNDIEFDEFDD
ncbi:hypothetical protein BDP27DRAFT_1434802 [Rhodocollybia butyracea]|uniref:Uncharacterized protein n=1 Tax=Rhodocollybia butyracea TaxID=206335 RepID=A0A9P5P390_9AGAR|nr:hypothetical protein BDP27DRAFT_1434802 [Rhodocollybia butyracea]